MEKKPKKTILFTGTAASRQSWALELRGMGYGVIHLPLIEAVPYQQREAEEQFEQLLPDIEAIAFLSKESVAKLSPAMAENLKKAAEKRIKMVAIGGATARELRKLGISEIHMANYTTAEGVVEWLAANKVRRAVMFRSASAKESLAGLALQHGVLLAEIKHYTSSPKKYAPGFVLAAWNMADAVLFSSPSGVLAFEPHWRHVLESGKQILVVAIGPTTAAALKTQGIEPDFVLPKPTARHLHQALGSFAA